MVQRVKDFKKMLQPTPEALTTSIRHGLAPETIVAIPRVDSCPAHDSREMILAHLMLHRLL